ncbi:hypothetical protein PV11_02649 [Exophiala sideris]|uniref:F-box domain-containing protein n=1 Tax=Exophiala sideris TaxID=1016849 RepID=A0A0D1YZX9_9EURO|nr:hypothetical protein PV11_02649 [Exophiala sideris]
MAMQDLAPEIMVHIYESLSSVSDIISLSLTCRYFHELLPKAQKLVLFFAALDKEMGPLDDILQLLTQNDNQMLHVRRTPPLSFALLTQAAGVGRVAERFVQLYPGFRWTGPESVSRRFLDDVEARRMRRAIYRLWSYTQAFHGKSASLISRLARSDTSPAGERLPLLRSWSTEELYELEDLRCTLEQLLATEICPTDGDVWCRMPEEARHVPLSLQHTFASHVPMLQDVFHSSRDALAVDRTKPSVQEQRYKHMQGWGSDLQNFYVIQSFLKFSPAQILWLYDNAVSKADVEKFIQSQTYDPCFLESGSMLFADWVTVLLARGVDVQRAREAIWDGQAGIVLDE